MIAEAKTIIKDIKSGRIAPVYLLDGEENFHLDELADFLESELIPEHEKDFNQIVYYGKDGDWREIITACRRFPMFAERQLVMVKDAAQLKGINELTGYLQHPLRSTVLVLHHRDKKLDGRGQLLKIINKIGVHFHSAKIKDEHVPQWIFDYGKQVNLSITHTAAELLASFLGNDLQKAVNEIEKVRINLPPGEQLTPELVQKYIGVSKEYNLFELPETFAFGNMEKFSSMLAFFIANPKKAPTPLFIKIFYDFYNQLYLIHHASNHAEKELAALLRTWPSKIKVLRKLAQAWPLPHIETALLIIARYAAAGVGVNHYATDKQLIKEMMGQLYALMPKSSLPKR